MPLGHNNVAQILIVCIQIEVMSAFERRIFSLLMRWRKTYVGTNLIVSVITTQHCHSGDQSTNWGGHHKHQSLTGTSHHIGHWQYKMIKIYRKVKTGGWDAYINTAHIRNIRTGTRNPCTGEYLGHCIQLLSRMSHYSRIPSSLHQKSQSNIKLWLFSFLEIVNNKSNPSKTTIHSFFSHNAV